MHVKINLVSETLIVKRSLRKFFVASSLLFLTMFIVSLGLLFYIVILKTTESTLDVQNTQAQNALTRLNDQKLNALILKERLGSIQKLLGQRRDITTKLISVLSLIPGNVKIETLDATDEKVSIKATSVNLSDMNTLVENNIETLSVKNNKNFPFKRIDMTGFGFDTKKLVYFVSLNAYSSNEVLRK